MAVATHVSDNQTSPFSSANVQPALGSLLLSFLGLRDQQPLIAQANLKERALKLKLQQAYDEYSVSPKSQLAQSSYYEALTDTIETLEREHARALEFAQARSHSEPLQKDSSKIFSLFHGLRNGLASWFNSSEAEHYRSVANELALHLQSLLQIRDALARVSASMPSQAAVSHTQRRRLLQDNSSVTAPVTQQQYYLYPNGATDLSRVINGVTGFAFSSYVAGNAGDINRDGLADMMISGTGKANIIFGTANSTTWGNGNLNVTALMDGQRGFTFLAEANLAVFVYAAGDINGDGFADTLVSTYNSSMSKSYVMFGSNSNIWASGTVNVSSFANGLQGFVVDAYITATGDINGDGFTDLIAAAQNSSQYYISIVFGSNSSSAWGNGTVNLASLSAQQGFVVRGPQYFGSSLSAGDINGDGLTDLVINGPSTMYVLFGTKNTTAWGAGGVANISSLMDGQQGFALQGVSNPGVPIFGGDINGDGAEEFFISTPAAAYANVIFGSNLTNAWGTGNLTLQSLMDGQRGFGVASLNVGATYRIRTAGDINGDGLDDFMVGNVLGAPNAKASAGQIFIVFGSNAPGAWGVGVVDLPNLMNGNQGFTILGDAVLDQIGYNLGTVGDIDGDGLADIVVVNQYGKSHVMLTDISKVRFTTNNLRIAAGQTLQLSQDNLNISGGKGFTGNTNDTQVTVDLAEQGYFSLVTSPAATLSYFSMQQLRAALVQFVHTGSGAAPQYRLCVNSWGYYRKICSDARVEFLGYPPRLINNQLTAKQGQPTTIQASDLSVFDQDNLSPNQLFFIIGNLSHGNFTLRDAATNTTTNVTVFSQQAVLKGNVQFNHDGTRNKPSYTVRVNDTKSVTDPEPATITFTFAPQLSLPSAIVLDQGQPTTLNSFDINATDEETFFGSIIIEAENITAGRFVYTNNLNYTITSFQQLSLITGGVQFVQDGSGVVPSFVLRAFDGTLRSPWQTPLIKLNHRPIRQGNGNVNIQVMQGDNFDFGVPFRFTDPDGVNDTLTYRAQLKGGSPLPPEIRFTPPNQFSGKISGVGSFFIEVQATDLRGVTGSTDFVLSVTTFLFQGIDIQKLYTSLSSIGGVGLTVMAYLWLRRRIAVHRRKFPFINDLRKTLNLEYYDFTRFDGDAYKTKLQKLQWDIETFYDDLSPEEQRSFAVCVAEILTKRGLVTRSTYAGGLLGVFCLLNVGWPNELNLKAFGAQRRAIAAEAVDSWKAAAAAEKEYQRPLNRWPYYSRTKREHCKVLCCCGKPTSANRWRATSEYNTTKLQGRSNGGVVALTELKVREATDDK